MPHTPGASLQGLLRHSLWADTLSAAERDAVLSASFERHVPAGAHALKRGDPADCWIGVIDGLVKMSLSLPDGRQSTLTGLTSGGWAGEGSLLRPGNWGYDAVALRDTRLACVPRHVFAALVAQNLAFNHFLLGQLNARLSLFIGLLAQERLLGPEARVARCLASLFHPDLVPAGGPFLRLSQEEIGLLAALSRQRTHAALHRLQNAGLLRVEFGGVTVLDLPGLRDWVGPTARGGAAPSAPSAPSAPAAVATSASACASASASAATAVATSAVRRAPRTALLPSAAAAHGGRLLV